MATIVRLALDFYAKVYMRQSMTTTATAKAIDIPPTE